MRRTVMAAALAAALGAAAAFAGEADPPVVEPGGPEFARFLFFATLEGACEDAVPDAAVEAFLEKDEKGRYRNFVYACPVCSPVLEGLRCYGMRDRFYYSRKGDPLLPGAGAGPSPVAALVARLDTPKDRGTALHDLLQRWIDRRIERLRLTDPERKAWRQAMAIGRKKGMGVLDSSEGFAHKSCPSCDAAGGCPFEGPK
jgi:hypothetical protein